jgi:hypothetical protein
MAPLQLTSGLASETVPDAGFAPRVIGMTTMVTATTRTQSSAANAYLNRMIAEIFRVSASFLNISESPFGYRELVSDSSSSPYYAFRHSTCRQGQAEPICLAFGVLDVLLQPDELRRNCLG